MNENERVLKTILDQINFNELKYNFNSSTNFNHNIKHRHPNEKEIYEYVRDILLTKKNIGYINTQQYRTLLGFARKNNKQCERYLRNWFLKHDIISLCKIEEYINSTIEYENFKYFYPSIMPVTATIIEIKI